MGAFVPAEMEFFDKDKGGAQDLDLLPVKPDADQDEDLETLIDDGLGGSLGGPELRGDGAEFVVGQVQGVEIS